MKISSDVYTGADLDIFSKAVENCPKKAKSFTATSEYTVKNGIKYITSRFDYYSRKNEGAYPICLDMESAEKRYEKLYKQYTKRMAGGGKFGWDWATLYVTDPMLYFEMKYLANQIRYSRIPVKI